MSVFWLLLCSLNQAGFFKLESKSSSSHSSGRTGRLIGAPASSPVIVVVVRLRVIVIFHHWEGHHVAAPLVRGTHPLHHLRTSVWEVTMDGKVPIILELELLLSWDRNLPVIVIWWVHLSRRQLLRLQSFLISSSTRRLASLALSYSVFLWFLKFATIHVLGCVGRPVKERKKSVVKKIRQFEKIKEIDVTRRNLLVCQNRQVSYDTPTIISLSRKVSHYEKGKEEGSYRDLSGPWF